MLSVGSVSSAGGAAGYYTKDNYYTADQTSAASGWFGEGAKALGLEGPIDATTFEAILSGQLGPDISLAGGPGGEHRPGIDLTFSAPKSVSLLSLVAGDTRLLAANMAAVKDTLAWAEKNLAETRAGAAGKVKPVATGNLVAALVEQDTSRNLDPQLHVHAVIANATKGPDGKWRALHNDKLWTHNTLLGAIYHTHLRANVEALGYVTEDAGKHGTFEIAGIDRDTIDAFSTRHTEIAAVADKLGVTDIYAKGTINLKTRARKTAPQNRAELVEGWREQATALGTNLREIVARSHEALQRGAAPWTRVLDSVKGAANRTTTLTAHFAEHLGLAVTDPLARAGLTAGPAQIAAAQGVASAIRHLSQREASFTTLEVAKAALDLGLPITIAHVEARIGVLEKKRLVQRGVADDRHRLTTRDAVQIESRLVETALAGRGTVEPIVASADEAATRAQAKAQDGQGHRLNPGQEAAARLLLASSDRVIAIQGVAGAGKSSALRPVAEIAQEEGRGVIALGPQNTLVQQLARDIGAPAQTIAAFVRKYESLLIAGVDERRVKGAQLKMRGAVVLVDESSMTSNDQALRLVLIAEKLQLGRLAFVGDKRQLGAVDAGKPFEMLQRAGLSTGILDENLRARGETVRVAARLANDGRVLDAYRALGDNVIEARGRVASAAIARYLALAPDERTATILLASGRKLRDELNLGVQAGLRAEGTLQGNSLTVRAHDKVTTTREQERYLSTYQPGLVAEFGSGLPRQKIPAGLVARVSHVDRATGRVILFDAQSRRFELDPARLPTTRTDNTLRLTRERELTIYEGDKLRLTDTDKDRGLLNGAGARVIKIGPEGVTIETSAKVTLTLPHGDRMLGRVDLGYALNAHQAQGATADRGIAVMDSRERNLTNQRTFLVNATRVRDSLTLIVDNKEAVARGLARNPGDKTSALEAIGLLDTASASADLDRALASRDRSTVQTAPDITPPSAANLASIPLIAPTPASVAPKHPSPAAIVPVPILAAEPTRALPLTSQPAATPETPRPQTKAPVPQKQLEMDI